jgi:AcrR family transcriptional regulator
LKPEIDVVGGVRAAKTEQAKMAKAVNHDVRKRMVVMKAMHLFARMGYARVSFITISEEAGIARTALYRYFKTKRELFDEAIYEITGGIMTELRDIMTRTQPVPKRLKIACGHVVDVIFEKRDFFLAIFDFVFSMVRTGEDMTDRIALFTDGLKLVFRKLVSEGLQEGSVAAGTDPEESADMLFSIMESVAFRVLLNADKDPEASKLRFNGAIAAISA